MKRMQKEDWVFIVGVLAILALIAFSQVACDGDDGVVTHAKTVLQTAKASWLGFQDQAAEMRLAGRLTDAQWAQWVDIDAKYRALHNDAVQALKIYESVRDKPAQEALIAALAHLSDIIQRAADTINAWQSAGGGGPGGAPAAVREEDPAKGEQS